MLCRDPQDNLQIAGRSPLNGDVALVHALLVVKTAECDEIPLEVAPAL